ncbi:hypothetical protein AAFC00_000476 [Neodothiora populina]|uniref:Uncharacterized protein n=1 Tax=Neodothiora populina TaxID=2781224 RepID=A0ABR3PDF8_9PEZI
MTTLNSQQPNHQQLQREPALSSSLTTPFTNTTDSPPPPPTSSTTPSAQEQQKPQNISNDRLTTPFPLRLPLCTLLASATGFLLGATHGGTSAGLRFRAENAHRLPTSQVGWYLYHKSKNYHAMLGGIKEGMKMGVKVGAWTGVFFAVEEAVDRLRGAVWGGWYGFRERRREEKRRGLFFDDEDDASLGIEKLGGEAPGVYVQRDFLSTVVAALGTAGAFSAWNRFPVETSARTALMGLKVGFGFGIAQDVVGLLRGRKLGYVEFVKAHVFGSRTNA